jgi:glycosyltransferase involved in cell wall biosynthesis
MRKQEPLISVVMPVYNAAQYLREAIDSILNQTFRDFEFIIINDGSTDRSLEIIQSYNDDRIRLINQKNTGLAKALNNGIAIAKSDFIARMDADDISIPERLTSQFSFLESNVDVVAVGSNAEVIDKEGNHVYCTAQPSTWSENFVEISNCPICDE